MEIEFLSGIKRGSLHLTTQGTPLRLADLLKEETVHTHDSWTDPSVEGLRRILQKNGAQAFIVFTTNFLQKQKQTANYYKDSACFTKLLDTSANQFWFQAVAINVPD